MFRNIIILGLLICFGFVAGCAQPPQAGQPLAIVQEEEKPVCVESEDSALLQDAKEEIEQQPLTEDDHEKATAWGVERDRALCYKLQPSVPIQGKKKNKGSGVVACCQPQSLIYARCRSGIATCRLGDTSPVQWFACAKKMGSTANIPARGSIVLLDVNVRRKIYTGHPLYVEDARKGSNGNWLLRVSHTNYDRQCHLDQDSEVIFDPGKMTVSFLSGPWSCWASDLKILGFILR